MAVIINGAIVELADINKDPVNDTELFDELNVKLLDPLKTPPELNCIVVFAPPGVLLPPPPPEPNDIVMLFPFMEEVTLSPLNHIVDAEGDINMGVLLPLYIAKLEFTYWSAQLDVPTNFPSGST